MSFTQGRNKLTDNIRQICYNYTFLTEILLYDKATGRSTLLHSFHKIYIYAPELNVVPKKTFKLSIIKIVQYEKHM